MNGMQSFCQGDGREKLFEMIAELERQVAQRDELLKMQHELVTKLREEACQRQTT